MYFEAKTGSWTKWKPHSLQLSSCDADEFTIEKTTNDCSGGDVVCNPVMYSASCSLESETELKSSESEEELISNIDADLVDNEVRNVSEPELLENFDPHDPLQSEIHSHSSEERSEYHFLIRTFLLLIFLWSSVNGVERKALNNLLKVLSYFFQ
uniref:Uncharacterized protein n=1 Tax=Amphimedon queenslandica TaxID=400682 RepID=A0A1X7SYI7_AMPQE